MISGTSGYWGVGCQTLCNCGTVGTSLCDKQRGCICVAGWKGVHCDEDVNECDDVTKCSGSYQYCINTPGSYTCGCDPGYQLNDANACIG